MNATAKSTTQQQTTGQPFNTDQILNNIKNKLFNSQPASNELGQQNTAKDFSKSGSAQHNVTRNSQNQSAQTQALQTSAQRNSKGSFSYDDFEDFNMNDDLGTPAEQTLNGSKQSKSNNPQINAAYRAYQGNKYNNVINENPQPLSAKFESFDDFTSYDNAHINDENTLKSHSRNNKNSFENEGFNDDIFENENVRAFPNRSQNLANSSKAPVQATAYTPAKQQSLYTPSGSESINSVMARMLQKEISSYISSWAGQNNAVVTRYIQEACDQIAQEWCNANMPNLMNNAVTQWCNANLEDLCASVIREELHKEQKTA